MNNKLSSLILLFALLSSVPAFAQSTKHDSESSSQHDSYGYKLKISSISTPKSFDLKDKQFDLKVTIKNSGKSMPEGEDVQLKIEIKCGGKTFSSKEVSLKPGLDGGSVKTFTIAEMPQEKGDNFKPGKISLNVASSLISGTGYKTTYNKNLNAEFK